MGFTRLSFYLFLVSIPFGTRVLVYQFTTGFHEYEAVFLYASDIFLVLFLASFWLFNPTPSKKRGSSAPAAGARSVLGAFFIRLKIIITNKPIKTRLRMFFSGVRLRPKSLLIAFLLSASISIFWSWNSGLAIYNFVRLVLLALMALAVGKILRDGIIKLDSIFAVIVGSAVLQSLIGFIQFLKQSSLGLGFLGESVLGPFIGGTAKIIVEGAPIIRAYGTFPHPNVLAAFLVLGLLSCYHLFFQFYKVKTRKILTVFGIFVILLGLILTFSRTAWVIGILMSILLISSWLISKEHRGKAIFLSIILASIFCFLVFSFSSFIFPRAQISINEPAVSYRLAYNELGLDLIKNHPFGIGIGNQVLYSVKNGIYEKFGMDKVWQWQPIHNIYLLIASEIGVLGLLAFLVFIATLLIYKKFQKLEIVNCKLKIFIAKKMLLALLFFAMFDHFLWTLQPGRLMLWLVIGILMSVSRAHSDVSVGVGGTKPTP